LASEISAVPLLFEIKGMRLRRELFS